MNPASPLPDAALRPFLSRRSVELGISTDRLRRGDVMHPFRGVSSAAPAGSSILGRARDFEPLLRNGQLLSHTTSLALHGVPIPDDGAVHVSVRFPRTPPRGRGVHGHSLQRLEPTMLDTLPVSTPAAAWIESAALVSREDLVALGDGLLPARHRPGLTTLEELRAAADRIGVPGLRRAQWALPRIRPGVRARPETHLRLAVVAAGMPEPLVEHPVAVAPGLVLHPDLLFLFAMLGLEYEGDGHRTDRQQWMRDIERRELFESAGVRIMRVTARDLYPGRRALMARIADALRARS